MHKFKLQIDNVHRFIVQQNNIHKFIIHALEATSVLELDLDQLNYYTRSNISSKDIPLNDYTGVMLKDLPQSLRQFVGAYVYVLARMRASWNYESDASTINAKIAMKVQGIVEHTMQTTMSLVLRFVIGLNQELYKSDVSMKGILAWRGHLSSEKHRLESIINEELGVRCRGVIPYVSDLRNEKNAKAIAKVKGEVAYHNEVGIDDGKIRQYGCIQLREYANVMLKDLPTALKDFCYREI